MRSIRGTSREVEDAAKRFRRDGTTAEDALWEALRAKQVAGLRFRRQHPLGRFVLDFCCPAIKLAVEVDGGVHDVQREHDAERTAVLESFGYRVLRFRNERVLDDLPGVIAEIASFAPPPE